MDIIKEMYNDATLYFSVLPHDFVDGHLKKFFSFNFKWLQHFWRIQTKEAGQLAFTATGVLIAPMYHQQVVCLYDCEKRWCIQRIPTHRRPRSCVVDNEGQYHIASGGSILTTDGSRRVNVGYFIFQLVANEDILLACTSRGIKIFDAENYDSIGVLHNKKEIRGAAVNRFGETVTNCSSDYVRQLAVDIHGNTYLTCDESPSAVYVYGMDGLMGSIPYEFANPVGVAICHSTGVVAVSDDNGIHLFH